MDDRQVCFCNEPLPVRARFCPACGREASFTKTSAPARKESATPLAATLPPARLPAGTLLGGIYAADPARAREGSRGAAAVVR